MNQFIRKNLEIKIGDKVRIDGHHRSFESIRNIFTKKPITVTNIGTDDLGEFIEIKTDNGDTISLFRHTLSLVGSVEPCIDIKINERSFCILGKRIEDIPYITESSQTYGDSIRLLAHFKNLRDATRYPFKIIEQINGLFNIQSVKYHDIVFLIAPYMVYKFSSNMFYQPKNIIR